MNLLKERMMLNLTKTAVCCLAVESLSSVSDASEAITYRLSKTKEMHFEDGRKAVRVVVWEFAERMLLDEWLRPPAW